MNALASGISLTCYHSCRISLRLQPQYNGIKCNPVERNEGRNKFQAMSAEVEETVASSRTRSLDCKDHPWRT